MVFKEKYFEFFEKIGISKFMVLSTSKDDLITFRLMGYVVMLGDLLKIKHFVKYLKKNIQVHTKIIHF